MALEFLNGVSVFSVVAEQLEDHVLEVIWEAVSIYLLEVSVNLASKEKVVEVLLFAGFLEGEDALYDNEDDHANAEQVYLGSIVGFSLLDLGSHVSHGASVRL